MLPLTELHPPLAGLPRGHAALLYFQVTGSIKRPSRKCDDHLGNLLHNKARKASRMILASGQIFFVQVRYSYRERFSLDMKQSKLLLKDLATFQQTFLPRTGDSAYWGTDFVQKRRLKADAQSLLRASRWATQQGMLVNAETISTECIPETFPTYLASGPS